MIPVKFVTAVGISNYALGVSYLSDLFPGDLRRMTYLFIRDTNGYIQSGVLVRAEEVAF